MSLEDTLKNLEEKYIKPVENKKEEYKPSYHYISLVFKKDSPIERSFLDDLGAFGFQKVLTGSQNYYTSSSFERTDIKKIETILNKKREHIRSPFQDVIYKKNARYSDIIRLNKTELSICVYDEKEREKNLESNKGMEQYYSNLDAFEKNLMTKEKFKTEFCKQLASFIESNFNTEKLTSNNKTSSPIGSLVNDVFNFTEKLLSSSIIDLQSKNYGHMYLISSAMPYDDNGARDMLYKLKEKPDYKFYSEMIEITKKRFSGIDSIKPLKGEKASSSFPKEYDINQISEDSDFSISKSLSKEFLTDRHIPAINEIVNIITKTAIQYIQVNNANYLHQIFTATNASSKEMADVVVGKFSNPVDWRNWGKVLEKELNDTKTTVSKRKLNKPT